MKIFYPVSYPVEQKAYIPVCGGGKPIVCTSYQQSTNAHGYVDSVADLRATYNDMCTNGMGAQHRSYFVVLSLHVYTTHVIFDDYEKKRFMFMDYITYQLSVVFARVIHHWKIWFPNI